MPNEHEAEPHPALKAAVHLLRMIQELHVAGFQRVRFSSGMAPSGVHRRCAITHIDNMTEDGLSILDRSLEDEVAHYTTGSLDRYFGWPDAQGRSAKELAALFSERFPRIVEKGAGRDWSYAGWLTEMIGRAEIGEAPNLPVFFADYPITLHTLDLPPTVQTRPPRKSLWEALLYVARK